MGFGAGKQEARMIAEQEQYTCVQSLKRNPYTGDALVQPQFTPDVTHNRLFEFAANARVTLAERHPRLAVLAVSAAVLFAAIAAEVDCLSGSGYFWR
jgi:hypothetical protein